MGLQDDMNKANAAARSAESGTRDQVEATFQVVQLVWNDLLAYCKDFATLAPQNGLQPQTGTVVTGRSRHPDRNKWDDAIDHPGGWAFNRWPYGFYITTAGALLVEAEKQRKSTRLLPLRTVLTRVFEPYRFPAAPPDHSVRPTDHIASRWLPGKFQFRSSPPFGCPDIAKEDIARLGGTLVIEVSDEERIFPKEVILRGMTRPPGDGGEPRRLT